MCGLMQRAGRAARAPDVLGEFIWLVEAWCFGITLDQFNALKTSPQSQSQASHSQVEQSLAQLSASHNQELLPAARPYKGTLAASEAERRSKMPRGFWKLINKDRCIRLGILEFFDEDLQDYAPPAKYCCSKCSDDLKALLMNLKPPYLVKDINTGSKIGKEVKAALEGWRDSTAPARFNGYLLNDPAIFLSDSLITRISRTAGTLTSLQAFGGFARKQWSFFDEYGAEVLGVIQLAVARSKEATTVAVRAGGLQRRPLQEIDCNSSFSVMEGSKQSSSLSSVPKRRRLNSVVNI
jgi:hypothetical protein